ncbi:MAG: glycosyltransferase [Candidatus Hodarchaeota archaeon]
MKFLLIIKNTIKKYVPTFIFKRLAIIRFYILNIFNFKEIKALYKKYLLFLKNKPQNTKSILFFPSDPIQVSPASRFRCYFIAKHLRSKGIFTAVVSTKLTRHQRKKILKIINPDWVWIQKVYHPLNRYKFFKEYNILFDIDDADFFLDHLRKSIHEFYKNSKIITCGSEFIKKYAEKFSNNVYKIWTPFPVNKNKKFKSQYKKQIIIGWTPRNADAYYESIKQLYKPLLNLHNRYNIIFRIIGGNVNKVKKLFSNLDWVQIIPSQPYNIFLKILNKIDIGIHPLTKTPHNLAKSFGKTLTYMNAGIVCVVSNIGENSIFFKDGVNGFLANTAEEWEIKLGKLIENQSLREKFADKAYKNIQEYLSLDTVGNKYIELLFGSGKKTLKN